MTLPRALWLVHPDAAAYRHALRPPTTIGDDWELALARERRIRGGS